MRRGDRVVERGPLSFAQQRMWGQLAGDFDPLTYQVVQRLVFEGDLDVDALRTAIARVVERHPSLRTRFRGDGAEILQEVVERVELDHSSVDLAHLPDRAWTARLDSVSLATAARPFDLGEAPLFRTVLVQLPGGRAALVLVLHHIVSDEHSMGVLLEDLAAAYTAARSGVETIPSEPAAGPIEYARWQRDHLGREQERLVAYWRAELDGADVSTWLAERPRDVARSRGRLYRTPLGDEVQQALTELAAAVSTTTFTVLVTAFAFQLARRTGRRDVVLIAPVANRIRREHEELIALVANNVLLRVRFEAGATFRDALQAVQRTLLRALDHQALPLGLAIEQVLKPAAGPLPRFPTVQFVVPGEGGRRVLSLPGVRATVVDVPFPGARTDLGLFVMTDQEGFGCTCIYDENVVSEEELTALVADFVHTLRLAHASPDAPADLLAAPARRA